MRNVLIYLFILSISLLQISCQDFSAVRDKHTLYIHLSSEPSHLNPITSTEAVATSINSYIYETLLDRDYDTLELVPQLAERWEIASNKLRYIFYLKKGVLWSDGKEFTADDIIYSYQTIKDPKVACAPLKVYFIDVASVRKLDRYTVEFLYSRPYFRALEICGGIPIVPRHIFDDGSDFNTHRNNRHPIGTGPYRFERWDTGKKIVLAHNERYRDKKPAIRRVVYKVVPEINVALQMLKKGELDLMAIRSIQWVRQTNSEKFKESFYKLKYYTPNYNYIGWNARRIWFRDKRVRIALTYLINREAILQKLQFGLGKIVTGNFYVFGKDYNKDVQPWPHDPGKGRELLREAGWVDRDRDGLLEKNGKPFRFTFTIPSGSKFAERLATIIKEDFSKAGIEITINRFEWAVFVKKLHERDFDAVTLAWSLDWESDPYQLWHSSQVEQGSNFCDFNNSEADTIIERARKEFDRRKRMKMFHRFHELIHEEQPYTFLFCNPSLVVVSRRFDNVNVHRRGLHYVEWRVRE